MDEDGERGSGVGAESGEATLLLRRVGAGDSAAASELLPLVYDRLRSVAAGQFRGQRADHTLQPTALVHEVYLKLIRASDGDWKSHAHFCAVAATAMRQVLRDHARGRRAAKRGGGAQREALDDIATPGGETFVSAVALDDALEKLSGLDARKARLVELRFFGGLTAEETAEALGVSLSTVEKEWRSTRAWLSRELADETKS